MGRCMKKWTWVMWCVYMLVNIYMANVFLEGDADNSTLATPVHVQYPCKLAW